MTNERNDLPWRLGNLMEEVPPRMQMISYTSQFVIVFLRELQVENGTFCFFDRES